MKKHERIFLSAQESGGLLPELTYDLLLGDGPYPFLFTCTAEDEKRTFLVVCHTSDVCKAEWVVAECPLERLEGLLTDRVTMRDAFGAPEDEAYLVTRLRDGSAPTVKRETIRRLEAFLPTAGFYMDVEEGEFDEELGVLRARARRNAFTLKDYREQAQEEIRSTLVTIPLSYSQKDVYYIPPRSRRYKSCDVGRLQYA